MAIDQQLRIALYPPRSGLPGATVAEVIALAGGGGAVEVQDDGAQIVAVASVLNFTSGGVTVTDGGGGEAIVNIPGSPAPLEAIKPADTVRSNDAVVSDDPDLTFSGVTAGRYVLEGFITVLSGAGGVLPNFKFKFIFSAFLGLQNFKLSFVKIQTAGVIEGDTLINNLALDETVLLADGATMMLKFVILFDATGVGDIDFQWSQDTSSATAITVEENSSIRITQLA